MVAMKNFINYRRLFGVFQPAVTSRREPNVQMPVISTSHSLHNLFHQAQDILGLLSYAGREIETRYYNQRTGKEEWRCKHCDRPMPVLGVLRLLQNILRTLLLTVTACQKEPHEQVKLRTISRKLVLRQKKIPGNAVSSMINPETRSTLTSSKCYT